MRIVLANKFLYPRGGAERAVLELGRALDARGHAVSYFGMDHPDNVVRGPHVAVVRQRDYRQPGAAAVRDAASMLYSFAARRTFGAFLDRVHPDVVHLHNIYHQLTPSILDAARERGIPLIMTLHDYKLVCPRYDMLRHGMPCDACVEAGPVACVRYRCAAGSWGASLLLAAEAALHRIRGSYDAVARFIVPSRFLGRVLERAGFDPARLRHVPNFASRAHVVPVPSTRRFVYVGRLSPEKGILTLLRAAARIGQGELVLCGTGPLAAEVERWARAAPPGRVVCRGHLAAADVAAEVDAARFVVAPSEWFENAPFAVLEAMAAGRAVLTTPLGGLPELIEDGVEGELVPPGDEVAWAGALERALEDPERASRMGAAARRRAIESFALETHVDRIESVYAEAGAS